MTSAYRFMEHVGAMRIAGAMLGAPIALMYHRFGDSGIRGALPRQTLERQLEHLRERHHVFTASLFSRLGDAGDLPSDAVTLTIDDGYADVYSVLFPLLRKYSLPATIYVVTDFIDGQLWLWPDRLAHVLDQTARGEMNWPPEAPTRRCPLRTQAQRAKAWSDIADDLLVLSAADREDAIRGLATSLDAALPDQPPERYKPLTWAQIREMREFGIEIGSHTRTHPRLSMLSADEAWGELVVSKRRLADALQCEIESLAYPYGGAADVSHAICVMARAAGYNNAFASYPESARLNEPLLRPRFSAPIDFADFLAVVAGLQAARVRLGRAGPIPDAMKLRRERR